MRNQPSRVHNGGFALIEAMVAMLVMAFGMLSLVGMQSMLARNADLAKQRTEAQRLAGEKLECLRAYTQIAASTTTAATRNCMGALLAVYTWSGMSTVASDPVNPLTTTFSNTSYTRSWTIGGATADPMRTVTVTVAWTDRSGAGQTYTSSSVISQSNPDNEGALGFPLPQNTNLKRPKNRNINIPVPAVDLGGGLSAYQINSTLAVIFSNNSGYVIRKCSVLVTAANYASLGASCTDYSAYIIAGYISGDSTWTASYLTFPPIGINTVDVTGWDMSGSPAKTISCSYPLDTARDQNNSNSATNAIAGFKYYLCVIPVTNGGGTWSGTMRMAGMTTGNSSSRWLVCRFQYPASIFQTDNERNVQPYANVNGSLDSQNYYIVSGSSCPTVSLTTGNGPSQQTTSVTTVLHQDCRTSTATATNCPTTYTGP